VLFATLRCAAVKPWGTGVDQPAAVQCSATPRVWACFYVVQKCYVWTALHHYKATSCYITLSTDEEDLIPLAPTPRYPPSAPPPASYLQHCVCVHCTLAWMHASVVLPRSWPLLAMMLSPTLQDGQFMDRTLLLKLQSCVTAPQQLRQPS
jgi:hypothetical protein